MPGAPNLCPKRVDFETHSPLGDQQQRIIYMANNCSFFTKSVDYRVQEGAMLKGEMPGPESSERLSCLVFDFNFAMITFTNLPVSAIIKIKQKNLKEICISCILSITSIKYKSYMVILNAVVH